MQENIKNPFELFNFITTANQIYKNITIRKLKEEYKIDIKEHDSQEFIEFLKTKNINSKVMIQKTPFFITNLPRGVSQHELTTALSSIYPNSSIRIFKSSKKCGQALIPTQTVQNCSSLRTASTSNEGTPIIIPPLPPIYFRPYNRNASKPRVQPKPSKRQNNSNSYASAASMSSSSSIPKIQELEDKIEEQSSKIAEIEKQVSDLNASQGHIQAKIHQFEQIMKSNHEETKAESAAMTFAINRLCDAFNSFRNENDSDLQMSEPAQTAPNIANTNQTAQISASTEQICRATEETQQYFEQSANQYVPLPIQQFHLDLHYANSKRALSSSPIFQQIHPNMIPARIQPTLHPHPT